MKKIWLILIIFAVSCDKQKPSNLNKKLGQDEVKLVNPWVNFQTQYKIKNKKQERC